MYEELVKRLRYKAGWDESGDLEKAADAIEKLSMRIHGDEAAIAGMKREIERMVVADKPRWIPVTERLPEEKGNYLVVQNFGHGAEVHEAFFFRRDNDYGWFDPVENYEKYNPNHWMPLPEQPKDGET